MTLLVSECGFCHALYADPTGLSSRLDRASDFGRCPCRSERIDFRVERSATTHDRIQFCSACLQVRCRGAAVTGGACGCALGDMVTLTEQWAETFQSFCAFCGHMAPECHCGPLARLVPFRFARGRGFRGVEYWNPPYGPDPDPDGRVAVDPDSKQFRDWLAKLILTPSQLEKYEAGDDGQNRRITYEIDRLKGSL